MKFLIDNNLSFKLVDTLATIFINTTHVRETVGVDADDITIWNFARKEGFIILPKDSDFNERSQVEGCPPKIVHLICGNRTTAYIQNLLLLNKEELIAFGETDTENCLLKLV